MTKQELQLQSLVAQLKLKSLQLDTLTEEVNALKKQIIELQPDGVQLDGKPLLVKKNASTTNWSALVQSAGISQHVLARYKKVSIDYDYARLVEDKQIPINPKYVTNKVTYAWYLKNK